MAPGWSWRVMTGHDRSWRVMAWSQFPGGRGGWWPCRSGPASGVNGAMLGVGCGQQGWSVAMVALWPRGVVGQPPECMAASYDVTKIVTLLDPGSPSSRCGPGGVSWCASERPVPCVARRYPVLLFLCRPADDEGECRRVPSLRGSPSLAHTPCSVLRCFWIHRVHECESRRSQGGEQGGTTRLSL